MAASIKKQMWRKMKTKFKSLSMGSAQNFIFNPHFPIPVMMFLFLAEFFVCIFVISQIKYTEIDWNAYMQEVEGVINGTYDYTQLKGDTGPLVYPAGFVYIFTVFYHMTSRGLDIQTAQCLFAGLYLASLVVIFDIYRRVKKVPPFVFFFMCCASYRIHSIYMLRMFNDPVAMLFLYIAIDCFLVNKWSVGCLMFSFGVSIKMNILLFAPGLLMLLLASQGTVGTIKHLVICAVPQVLLAAPFLAVNPMGYIIMSFNLGRQFFYKWTVNWRLVSEDMFLNKYFQLVLLAGHIVVLLIFVLVKWKRFLPEIQMNNFKKTTQQLSPNQILLPLFTSNFIGMCFSRSLHYQFYVWYFHSLHYLLWSTNLPIVVRVLLLGVIELCWNTYPSTVLSSSLLHICHLVVLIGLWYSPEYTVTAKKTVSQKEL